MQSESYQFSVVQMSYLVLRNRRLMPNLLDLFLWSTFLLTLMMYSFLTVVENIKKSIITIQWFFVSVYQDENTLIPKNSALIVVRVPLTAQQKRAW